MSTLLLTNSSARGERSITRRLTAQFQQQWEQANAGSTVVPRDLAANPVPPVNEAWIVGAFSPPEGHTSEVKAALSLSDQLVDELLSADRYVFGVPMYNFSIPSSLKSYIDQVVRVGRTFRFGADGREGLAKGKKAIFVTASGGTFQVGTPAAPYNFQEPYLRAIFGFIGITDIQFVVADSQSMGGEAGQGAVTKAEATLQDLAASW